MDALYARGTAARARETAAALSHGVDPGTLPCGYYRVREAQHWRVVRWMPQAYRWELGGGMVWSARYWAAIGAKVA